MTPEPEQEPDAALAFREYAERNGINLNNRFEWWARWAAFFSGWKSAMEIFCEE